MNHAAIAPWRAAADAAKLFWKNPVNPIAQTYMGRSMAASLDLFERVTRRYGKPTFGITDIKVDGVTVSVAEARLLHKTFCTLLHFSKRWPAETSPAKQPKLLIVAPMSGHYATLLRGTVAAMLPHADVYITDWVDARQVPLGQGSFDLDDYIDYVIEMLELLGPDVHLMAVCQPSVPVLSAVSFMSRAQCTKPSESIA